MEDRSELCAEQQYQTRHIAPRQHSDDSADHTDLFAAELHADRAVQFHEILNRKVANAGSRVSR